MRPHEDFWRAKVDKDIPLRILYTLGYACGSSTVFMSNVAMRSLFAALRPYVGPTDIDTTQPGLIVFRGVKK
jgi:hypothetical protein